MMGMFWDVLFLCLLWGSDGVRRPYGRSRRKTSFRVIVRQIAFSAPMLLAKGKAAIDVEL